MAIAARRSATARRENDVVAAAVGERRRDEPLPQVAPDGAQRGGDAGGERPFGEAPERAQGLIEGAPARAGERLGERARRLRPLGEGGGREGGGAQRRLVEERRQAGPGDGDLERGEPLERGQPHQAIVVVEAGEEQLRDPLGRQRPEAGDGLHRPLAHVVVGVGEGQLERAERRGIAPAPERLHRELAPVGVEPGEGLGERRRRGVARAGEDLDGGVAQPDVVAPGEDLDERREERARAAERSGHQRGLLAHPPVLVAERGEEQRDGLVDGDPPELGGGLPAVLGVGGGQGPLDGSEGRGGIDGVRGRRPLEVGVGRMGREVTGCHAPPRWPPRPRGPRRHR